MITISAWVITPSWKPAHLACPACDRQFIVPHDLYDKGRVKVCPFCEKRLGEPDNTNDGG